MRVNITIENYEQFAIDYIEGKLSGDALQSFLAFMQAHPNIALEIESIAEFPASLESTSLDAMPEKDALKLQLYSVGSITGDNYEGYFAAAADAVLSNSDMKDLQRFLQLNPALAYDFKLYQSTRIVAPATLQYEHKNDLKKTIPIWVVSIKNNAMVYRAAAMLVLVLGAWVVLQLLSRPSYEPRNSDAEFVQIEAQPQRADAIEPKALVVSVKSESQEIDFKLADVKRDDVELAVQITETPTSNDVESEQPKGIEKIEVLDTENILANSITHTSKTAELNAIQFIGTRFLQLEAAECATAKELLRNSAEMALAKNDRFIIHDHKEADKNSLQILAGAFEFKKVTYKEN